jgi:Protein of unknown function (DUF4239)
VGDLTISGIVFACVLGGASLGMFLRVALPEGQLSTDSKDLVKLGMGLIGTMAAVLLGLLIASAKSSYDTRRSELTQMSANLILLDRAMAHYGPEAKEARDLLRQSVDHALDRVWAENSDRRPPPLAAGSEALYDKIQQLSPQNETQRSLQAQALKLSTDLGQMRWLMFEQMDRTIPMPFLVALVFWLTVTFVSFGLFAPSNPTVITTLLVCSLSVSGAIFLILELDQPYEGLIQISSAPLRQALAQLGR